MKKFFVTFGQKSPFRKGYVEVEAENYNQAKEKVDYALGKWGYSMIRLDRPYPESFTAGRLGEILK